MTPVEYEYLSALVESARPATLALIGKCPDELTDVWRKHPQTCAVDHFAAPNCYQPKHHYDIAIIYDPDGAFKKPILLPFIARLRDLDCKRLLVLVRHDTQEPTEQRFADSDFLALGLQRLKAGHDGTGNCVLYEFSLRNYKTTPDWLNDSNWANPQLWDKHRW